jgi:hypothetical protein
MVRLSVLSFLVVAILLSLQPTATGATVTGVVTDASGKPLENARIEHMGNRVIVVPTSVTLEPSADEIRTDAEGHFRVVTRAPAIVVRTPGYESQRLLVTGDEHVQVTLIPIKSTSRCRLSAPPAFKTKQANDIDYTATWFYIKTKDGPKGIISGSGGAYSWGAPSDKDVWTSVEYSEMMFEGGVVDAAGHSAAGKYWRSRTIFGKAAQYYEQSRETAEQLDCVMDRIPIKVP